MCSRTSLRSATLQDFESLDLCLDMQARRPFASSTTDPQSRFASFMHAARTLSSDAMANVLKRLKPTTRLASRYVFLILPSRSLIEL